MSEAIRIFCTDLDGTVYGDPGATTRFRDFWQRLPADARPWLCYSSGRLTEDQLRLIESSPLPEPDYLIGGVGTCLYDFKAGRSLDEYQRRFLDGWDLEQVEKVVRATPGVSRQPEEYQTQFKSSWYWENAPKEAIEGLRRRLEEEGLKASVIYSSGRDLDILPELADKGNALVWLCHHLGIPTRTAVVAGDTGNDISLFRVEGVGGIIVANAQPELLEAAHGLHCFRASRPEADGVIEGLRHWGL